MWTRHQIKQWETDNITKLTISTPKMPMATFLKGACELKKKEYFPE